MNPTMVWEFEFKGLVEPGGEAVLSERVQFPFRLNRIVSYESGRLVIASLKVAGVEQLSNPLSADGMPLEYFAVWAFAVELQVPAASPGDVVALTLKNPTVDRYTYRVKLRGLAIR